jgi:hypothetical protein
MDENAMWHWKALLLLWFAVETVDSSDDVL